jgi:hypothetical protein
MKRQIYYYLTLFLMAFSFFSDSFADVVQTDSTISIAAVGDVMMGASFPVDSSKTPPDATRFLPSRDGRDLFKEVTPALKSADITFCNLEGPLLDGGRPRKSCRNPESCYLFRTPTHYVNNLVAAGFDMASLANNHSRDFIEGLASTMTVLDRVGIAHSGKWGDLAKIEVKGRKVVMIAFAPYDGLYNLLEVKEAVKIIQELAQENDLIIVSLHGGAEGGRCTHVPDSMEVFFGEERGHLKQFARQVIDAGADLVIGHGPHVPRGLEFYKNRLIAYSLGNFCTYERFNLKGANGLTFILKVQLQADGAFDSGQVIACKQLEPGIPVLDPQNAVIPLLQKLSNADFGKTAAVIDLQGNIQQKREIH